MCIFCKATQEDTHYFTKLETDVFKGFTKGKYTFLNKKSIKRDLVYYAKDMLGALQNLHVQDNDTKICD